MASEEGHVMSPRTLRLHTDMSESTDEHGYSTPPRMSSPTSSQGSWVVDPEDGGWDGLGASPTLSVRVQERQLHAQEAERQPQRYLSPATSPLREWSRMTPSPPRTAEFPVLSSPPCSPGSVRSDGSSDGSRSSREGLVGLARDEARGDVLEIADPPVAYRSPSLPARAPAAAEAGLDAGVGCTTVGNVDVRMVNISAYGAPDAPIFITEGMTQEETKEAIAEAAGLESHVSRESMSPARSAEHRPTLGVSVVSEELEALSPSFTAARSPSARSGSHEENRRNAAPLSRLSVDATVEGMTTASVDMDEDDKFDGKYADRLWRWTGLITAAKMGVIPIIVCATVAALSTQSGSGGQRGGNGGGGGRSGGGTGGGGLGGGAGGGGGGTRCFSRRPRPRGGGGGAGCFPGGSDRHLYGCVPMPYCATPSVAVC